MVVGYTVTRLVISSRRGDGLQRCSLLTTNRSWTGFQFPFLKIRSNFNSNHLHQDKAVHDAIALSMSFVAMMFVEMTWGVVGSRSDISCVAQHPECGCAIPDSGLTAGLYPTAPDRRACDRTSLDLFCINVVAMLSRTADAVSTRIAQTALSLHICTCAYFRSLAQVMTTHLPISPGYYSPSHFYQKLHLQII